MAKAAGKQYKCKVTVYKDDIADNISRLKKTVKNSYKYNNKGEHVIGFTYDGVEYSIACNSKNQLSLNLLYDLSTYKKVIVTIKNYNKNSVNVDATIANSLFEICTFKATIAPSTIRKNTNIGLKIFQKYGSKPDSYYENSAEEYFTLALLGWDKLLKAYDLSLADIGFTNYR